MASKGYKNIEDYLPILHSKFPEFSIEDLRRILTHGSVSLYNVISNKGDISLSGMMGKEVFRMTIGRIKFQSIAHKFRYVLRKAFIRFKYLYKKTGEVWDGYYYFGLTEERFKELYLGKINPRYKSWESIRKMYSNTVFNFRDVILFRILDECVLNSSYSHFFRIKYSYLFGYRRICKNFETNKAEYFLTRSYDGFNYIIPEINNNINNFTEF